MAGQSTGPVDDAEMRRTDVLDELAAFLMHHAYDMGMSDADRLQTFTIVEAHQVGDDPETVESAMRDMGRRFRDDPEYQREWLPSEPQT